MTFQIVWKANINEKSCININLYQNDINNKALKKRALLFI